MVLDQTLTKNEAKMVEEQTAGQGKPIELGGYLHPNTQKKSLLCAPALS
ncbi:hypothetical protein EFA69_10555 [Rufibacter immobilis]|uniref:Uncharacterized protein n=1 Tax=Rufibacter immobilis TaxID=1348778 RepID=A0A3M9MWQ6_9BACT|nr:hypothetical protein EFA69_10555 [Rufibacter immobilis]